MVILELSLDNNINVSHLNESEDRVVSVKKKILIKHCKCKVVFQWGLLDIKYPVLLIGYGPKLRGLFEWFEKMASKAVRETSC